MSIQTAPYLAQAAQWPTAGKHILAQYTDTTIVVYQAYRPNIGHFAARHGYFGGPFRLTRMSWIKTNFLWMMYRNGWGTKPHQEVTLAISLHRHAFEQILRESVPAIYDSQYYPTYEHWATALGRSPVRLQWDPDQDPSGAPLARRAIQLGLSGSFLAAYAREWINSITDISSFVIAQRPHARREQWEHLVTPVESVYPVEDRVLASRLGQVLQ
jgi:hypothetical protein